SKSFHSRTFPPFSDNSNPTHGLPTPQFPCSQSRPCEAARRAHTEFQYYCPR
ncbi:hypothetical protein BOTBODRAFT_30241, partial [Botryobasidium botryosum FD-172 SS1]